MDTELSPDSGSEPGGRTDTGTSTGEVLTMSLFGVMVIIASICLVVW